MNLYAYVGNDPLNAIDPTGLFCMASRLRSCQDQNDPAGRVVRATEEFLKTGKSTRGLNKGERALVKDSAAAIEESVELGQNGPAGANEFYENVAPGGKWDVKHRSHDDRYAGASQAARERQGNWLFGAASAAWAAGAIGDSGGEMGLQVLLRGAGAVQRQVGTSRPEWGKPTDLFGPFGDDPRDQYYIKRGFKFFERNLSGCVQRFTRSFTISSCNSRWATG